MQDMWVYPADSGYAPARDLAGFTVEAPDGVLGRVDRQSDRPGVQHLVVDTGAWVFGRSVLVPAGFVRRISDAERSVTVIATKEQIKNAPRFTTDSETADSAYLTEVARYYAGLGLTDRPPE
ncbi:PRC-barrel domain containing protein [Streptomyces sp. NPDC048389]|uniref:PRC-barrel domain containing protein n=1 Tax=Streptomyces sp. NPDC048389 TaxID=3154622 RepID=UPI0034514C16